MGNSRDRPGVRRRGPDQSTAVPQDEIGALGTAFQGSIAYLNRVAGAARSLSQGDLDAPLEVQGDKDELSQAFLGLQQTVRGSGGGDGPSDGGGPRGPSGGARRRGAYRGAFRDLIGGVNATLDAVLGPIDAADAALQRLADGDLSARVEGDFKGGHARIQVAFNTAADAMADAVGPIGHNATVLAAPPRSWRR